MVREELRQVLGVDFAHALEVLLSGGGVRFDGDRRLFGFRRVEMSGRFAVGRPLDPQRLLVDDLLQLLDGERLHLADLVRVLARLRVHDLQQAIFGDRQVDLKVEAVRGRRR